jgi:hypothetical protein
MDSNGRPHSASIPETTRLLIVLAISVGNGKKDQNRYEQKP